MTESLPFDEALEGAVVARLFSDPAQLPVVSGSLAPADFYTPLWRKAYIAEQKLSDAGKAVDVVTLGMEIGDDIERVQERVRDAGRAPVEDYVTLLRGFAFRRRMISARDTLSHRASEERDGDKLLSELHDAVVKISQGYEDGALISPDKAADAYARTLAERAIGARPGLEWPLSTLADLLQPATGGELILVAARPSVGKTVLLEQLADGWAAQSPHPILFASLEMSLDQLFDRAISRATGLPAAQVIRGVLTKEAAVSVNTAVNDRRRVDIWYLDDPFATTNAVRAAAAKVRLLAGGLSGIVVDYIQLLKDRQDLPEVQRVTGISRTLKAIAREFEVPLVAASQLNRLSEHREDKRPKLSDLRESGALEQDADRVLALSGPLDQPRRHLEVLKARQGRLGHAELIFDGVHVRFRDAAVVQDEEDSARARAAEESNAVAVGGF